MAENYHEWSSCEYYGHNWQPHEDNPLRKTCTDCSDTYEDAAPSPEVKHPYVPDAD